MRIIAVRIGKLVTGPGYNNTRAEVEVSVDEGENPDAAADLARITVDREIRQTKEIDKLYTTLNGLREDVADAERELERLTRKIDLSRQIIRSNDRIQALAAAAGIPWTDAGPLLPLMEPAPAVEPQRSPARSPRECSPDEDDGVPF